MRARFSTAAATLSALAALAPSGAWAATQYTSIELPSSSRQHLALNNTDRVLSMRKDSPALQDQHIVIENWSDGGRNYSEFRPGTFGPGTLAFALAFNDNQQIVGNVDVLSSSGDIETVRAFVYRDGAFTDLSQLAPIASSTTDYSSASGINARGDVVGSWHDGSRVHAFLYRDGVVTDLGELADIEFGTTRANAINNNGQIVGGSNVPPPPGLISAFHAFIYDNGVMRDLGLLPGFDQAEAVAINDVGDVVGRARSGNHGTACFLWRAGTMVNMGTIDAVGPTPNCTVNAINNSGIAVGAANALPTPTTSSLSAAFVYQDGHMTDLNALIKPTDPIARNHVHLGGAVSINDRGEILTLSIVNGVATYYLLQPEDAGPGDDLAHYTFEGGDDGWHSTGEPIVTVARTDERKFAGTRSLGITFNSGGFASVSVDVPPAHAGQLVTFRVFIPADARLDWIQPFVLEGLEGGWRWSGNWLPLDALQLGAWNTLTVQIPSDATPLWQMGVEFFSSEDIAGTKVYIDSVDF
jgi:probable HAF family extracellular repeat protein